MPKAAILGSGPAGLLAAHACALNGVSFDIFSKAGRSDLYGAQFIGKEIPEIPYVPCVPLTVVMHGTIEQYREKVYGDTYPAGPDVLVEGVFEAYDIRTVYDWLWNRYKYDLTQTHFAPESFRVWNEHAANDYDFIFAALPFHNLCIDSEHSFSSVPAWAIGDAPDLGQRCPIRMPEDTVFYDGTENLSWYRAATIFGHSTVEWATKKKPPIAGVVKIRKPLKNDCTCYPEVIRIGRFGEWTKGVKVADAFDKTMETLQKTGVQGVLF